MKLFVASDIHGSAYWAKKMLAAYKDSKAERMILLGDILYHGPRNDLPKEYNPKEVIDLLNNYANEIYAVRGNCEAEVDQMVLKFPCLADYSILPLKDRIVFITHGHNYNLNNLPPLKENDVLLHGHTHIPAYEKTEKCYYFNPGSVSIPKENSHHGYMLIEDNSFRWFDFDNKLIKEITL